MRYPVKRKVRIFFRQYGLAMVIAASRSTTAKLDTEYEYLYKVFSVCNEYVKIQESVCT